MSANSPSATSPNATKSSGCWQACSRPRWPRGRDHDAHQPPSTLRARHRLRRRAVAGGDAADRRDRTVDPRPTSRRCRLTPRLCLQSGRGHPRPALKRTWPASPLRPRASASECVGAGHTQHTALLPVRLAHCSPGATERGGQVRSPRLLRPVSAEEQAGRCHRLVPRHRQAIASRRHRPTQVPPRSQRQATGRTHGQ